MLSAREAWHGRLVAGGIAAVGFLITIAIRAEVALLFIGAGLAGVLYCGSLFRQPVAAPSTTAVVTGVVAIGKTANLTLLGKLLLFFLKAGSLTFGSGLVIASWRRDSCRVPAG